MKRGILLLVSLLALIPAVSAECCNINLVTRENCDASNILHEGRCTSNEAFLLEYDSINKSYKLLKTFENGNEFLKVGEAKLLAKALESITIIPSNNERLQLRLDNKTLLFNGVESNTPGGFLTRYGVRADTSGNIEIPLQAYVGMIDIIVRNNKTSLELKQGSKKDITLTQYELETLKSTNFAYGSQSFNAVERLTLKGLYLDSGSFYSSNPEPFVEADFASYLLMFKDQLVLTNLSSTTPFKISFLDKDTYIYEINPPDKVLLSIDKNLNFRRDGDSFDDKWAWTVSAYTQQFSLGVDAKKVKYPSGCIEFPLSFAKVCPRQINKSELIQLNATMHKITLNNKTADIIEINSNKLLFATPTRMLTKMFIADDVAYRKLVLSEDLETAEIVENITKEENKTNVSQQPIEKIPKKDSSLKKYYSLKTLKILLYSLAAIIGIITLRRFLRQKV